MLQRIKSKKGFTLAELLIVVAIIAVLTAIAVPLFVTSLQKAQKAAFEANCDTLRTAGIAAILDSDSVELDTIQAGDQFYVTGTFNDGKLDTSKIDIEWVRKPGETTKKASEFKDWNDNGECEIIIVIDAASVTAEVKPNFTAPESEGH